MLGCELLHDIEGVLGSRGFGLDDLHEEGLQPATIASCHTTSAYAAASAARRKSPIAQLYRMRRMKPD